MYGLGLRPPFYAEAMRGDVPVDFFEIVTENFMAAGGRPLKVLEAVRTHYPVSLHGVSLNLGGTDPLDTDYLNQLRTLIRRCEPQWVSDHLCWTRHGGHHLHDLLPLPYAEVVVEHVAARIQRIQDFLGRRILIENLSSYVEFGWSSMREWDFLAAVAERADCLILLDLNNIAISAHNHGFDPLKYMDAMPKARVAQHHLAGHSRPEPFWIDTHDEPVPEEIWRVVRQARARFGSVPTILERDGNIPALSVLLQELDAARSLGECVGAQECLSA